MEYVGQGERYMSFFIFLMFTFSNQHGDHGLDLYHHELNQTAPSRQLILRDILSQ